ncbi:unnamed protein product [Arabis nemorensis]|uniref:NYN domain-containing protein n=1 Tax=Arabis nemorensis TaxID=586526 RepID=A0A565C2B7_9BRAS|nr:unnamed protein product [Arabis nemorensis]
MVIEEIPVGLLSIQEKRETFANAETGVYWDVEDFPVTDISRFCKKIRLALRRAGYHGKVSITAYGDKKESRYEDAGITFVSRGSKRARNHRMLLDIHCWAAENRTLAPTNLMVITKNIMRDEDDEDTQFVCSLEDLLCSSYNVLLAVPDDYQLEKIPFKLDSVWLWSALLRGKSHLDESLIVRQPPQEEVESVCPMCEK